MADAPPQLALSDVAARQLANATKTPPQMSTITPRWLTHLLPWVPVEAGIYRLNKVKDASRVTVACSRRGPMPEILQDGGEYFDPENLEEIHGTLKRLLLDVSLRRVRAERSLRLSRSYTWEACADATFGYVASFASRAFVPAAAAVRQGAA